MKNLSKTFVLLAALGGLLVTAGAAAGGTGGAAIGLLLGVATSAGTYWWSDRLALRLARAEPLDDGELDWLRHDMAELATAAAMPEPRLYRSPSPQPNAFATGRDPANGVVVVTDGLLDALPRDEVRAVLAHELGHIRNRDVLIGSIAAAVATGISFVANMAAFSHLFGGDDDESPGLLGFLGLVLLAPVAATVVQLAVSRTREYGADEFAARLTGDPGALARALRRLEEGAARTPAAVHPSQASAYIVNPLLGSGGRLASLFSTHPPIPDRIARLALIPVPVSTRAVR